MMDDAKKPTRRDFLRGVCGAAAVPLLISAAEAADKTTGSVTALDDNKTSGTTGASAEGTLHRFLSANILLASPYYVGKPAEWKNRRDLVVKIFRECDPDVICTQEVLHEQAADLEKMLDDYFHFGFAGPFMDAHPTGYHGVVKNVLMFRKSRYDMTSAGTYWLSETPTIAGSVSWDALRGRHVNWLRLRDRKSGKEFRVLDTHYDHKGQTARENMSRMINEEAAQYLPDFPQVLCGDLNGTMDNPAQEILRKGGWTDSWIALYGPEDPGRTYHKLMGPKFTKPGGKIDYIYYRGPVTPKASKIWKNHEGDKYPSDHYFVSADLMIG